MIEKNKLIIHCITYNHANFIRQCLDGFVMQKTNFPFQAWISDDCSTDGTNKIIDEYAKKYPNIIIPVKHKKNLGSLKNFLDLASKIKSEYVALCEGDDFFTDENKLQRQVDFLDAHPECSICFHQTRNFFDDGAEKDTLFPNENYRFKEPIVELKDLLKHNFIQTNSVVYRWRFKNDDIYNFFPDDIIPGDYYLHLLHAQVGKIGFIDGVMSAYRRNSNGLWWDSFNNPEKLHLKYGVPELKFYFAIKNNLAENKQEYYDKQVFPTAQYFMDIFIKNKEFKNAAEIINLCPELLDTQTTIAKKGKIKITLFGCIPFIKVQNYKHDKKWIKLFNFIPLFKIKW